MNNKQRIRSIVLNPLANVPLRDISSERDETEALKFAVIM